MADQSLQDLYQYIDNWSSSNIGHSPLTYLNPKATLSYSPHTSPFLGFGSPAAGWVTALPGLKNNIVFSRPNTPRDQWGLLKLLAHESAHTTQKNPLNYAVSLSKYKDADFPYYSENDLRPPKPEVYAELREMEALANKRKQWWETDDGNEYLSNLMVANPTTSKRDLIQTTDREMFPEFQVMHESPSKPQQNKVKSLFSILFGK